MLYFGPTTLKVGIDENDGTTVLHLKARNLLLVSDWIEIC